MDSRTTGSKTDVDRGLELIKGRMPSTYAAIKARAGAVGSVAFALVRRGLAGQPNMFWAMEGGYVVGTPFAGQAIERDVAYNMVTFGVDHVCIFGLANQGVSNGAH